MTCPEKDIVVLVSCKFMYVRNYLSQVKNGAFKQNYVHVSSLSILIIILGNVLKNVQNTPDSVVIISDLLNILVANRLKSIYFSYQFRKQIY